MDFTPSINSWGSSSWSNFSGMQVPSGGLAPNFQQFQPNIPLTSDAYDDMNPYFDSYQEPASARPEWERSLERALFQSTERAGYEVDGRMVYPGSYFDPDMDMEVLPSSPDWSTDKFYELGSSWDSPMGGNLPINHPSQFVAMSAMMAELRILGSGPPRIDLDGTRPAEDSPDPITEESIDAYRRGEGPGAGIENYFLQQIVDHPELDWGPAIENYNAYLAEVYSGGLSDEGEIDLVEEGLGIGPTPGTDFWDGPGNEQFNRARELRNQPGSFQDYADRITSLGEGSGEWDAFYARNLYEFGLTGVESNLNEAGQYEVNEDHRLGSAVYALEQIGRSRGGDLTTGIEWAYGSLEGRPSLRVTRSEFLDALPEGLADPFISHGNLFYDVFGPGGTIEGSDLFVDEGGVIGERLEDAREENQLEAEASTRAIQLSDRQQIGRRRSRRSSVLTREPGLLEERSSSSLLSGRSS